MGKRAQPGVSYTRALLRKRLAICMQFLLHYTAAPSAPRKSRPHSVVRVLNVAAPQNVESQRVQVTASNARFLQSRGGRSIKFLFGSGG